MSSETRAKHSKRRRAMYYLSTICYLCLLAVFQQLCFHFNVPFHRVVVSKQPQKPDFRGVRHPKSRGSHRDTEYDREPIGERHRIASEDAIPFKAIPKPEDKAAQLAAMKCSAMPWYNSTSKPMWIPGYPGSGSEMLRAVVTAISGIGGDDVYLEGNCLNNTATCKTHWPKFHDEFIPSTLTHAFAKRSVLLIRNPRDALSSYFNHEWEMRNDKEFHSTQAPEDDWNMWRDVAAMEEFSRYWVRLIRKWKRMDDYDVAFYLPYERLTDIETGPQLLSRLADEMRRNSVRVAPEEDIPCLWYQVVKGEKGASKTKRAPHKYVPSYTSQQKAIMLHELEKLQLEFQDDLELVEILAMYHEDIRSNLRIGEPRIEATRVRRRKLGG